MQVLGKHGHLSDLSGGVVGGGVGLSAAFFGDPLTPARVLGGLIVLLGVILTRVALDRRPRLL